MEQAVLEMVAVVKKCRKETVNEPGEAVEFQGIRPNEDEIISMSEKDAKIRHERLVHNENHLSTISLIKDGYLPKALYKSLECERCKKGKYHRKLSGSLKNIDRTRHIHVDTKGKIDVESVASHRYFLTIVEDFSS